MSRVAAWGVHLYTASSAVIGVWALVAIFEQEYRLAIYLQLLALVIDSTDGALARAVDVRRHVPWLDGRRLDDICDFFTYVLVPACMMVETEMLPHGAWVAAPILASAYGFSCDDAKTQDHFFTGWPSYWNVVVIYLYLLDANPNTALWVTLGLSVAVFVPLKYIYPSRTPVLRPLSLGILGVWLLGLSWLGVQPDPDPLWLHVSLLAPAYYLGLSLVLNLWTPGGSRRPGDGEAVQGSGG